MGHFMPTHAKLYRCQSMVCRENGPELAGELLVAAEYSAPALWKHPKGCGSPLMGIPDEANEARRLSGTSMPRIVIRNNDTSSNKYLSGLYLCVPP